MSARKRGRESRANDWIDLVRRVVEARRLHGQHGALPQCAEPSHNSLPTTTEDAIPGETRSRRSRAWEFIKHRKTTEPNGKPGQGPNEIQRTEKRKVPREKCDRGCCVCQLWCFHCSCWWIMRLYIILKKKTCRLYYTLSYICIFLGQCLCAVHLGTYVEKHGATQAHLQGELGWMEWLGWIWWMVSECVSAKYERWCSIEFPRVEGIEFELGWIWRDQDRIW